MRARPGHQSALAMKARVERKRSHDEDRDTRRLCGRGANAAVVCKNVRPRGLGLDRCGARCRCAGGAIQGGGGAGAAARAHPDLRGAGGASAAASIDHHQRALSEHRCRRLHGARHRGLRLGQPGLHGDPGADLGADHGGHAPHPGRGRPPQRRRLAARHRPRAARAQARHSRLRPDRQGGGRLWPRLRHAGAGLVARARPRASPGGRLRCGRRPRSAVRACRRALHPPAADAGDPRLHHARRSGAHAARFAVRQYQPGRADRSRRAGRGAQGRPSGLGRGRCLRARAGHGRARSAAWRCPMPCARPISALWRSTSSKIIFPTSSTACWHSSAASPST